MEYLLSFSSETSVLSPPIRQDGMGGAITTHGKGDKYNILTIKLEGEIPHERHRRKYEDILNDKQTRCMWTVFI
jgi:hypothetical protein